MKRSTFPIVWFATVVLAVYAAAVSSLFHVPDIKIYAPDDRIVTVLGRSRHGAHEIARLEPSGRMIVHPGFSCEAAFRKTLKILRGPH